MSLGADVQAHLPRLRDEAESRMLDACDVGEFADTGLDPVTGQPIPELVAEHYSGKCRIKSSSNVSAESDAGGQSYATTSFILSVPVADGGAIRTDDEVLVTAIDAVTGNPAMVGLKFRVTGLASGSQASAARFSLEHIS